MPEHNYSRYRRGLCKCEVCRAENAGRYRVEREERVARLAADPAIRPHGDRNTYQNWGCRCAPCRSAAYEYAVAAPRTPKTKQSRRASRGVRGLSVERERLLYEPMPGFNRHNTPEPFGREWLSDAS